MLWQQIFTYLLAVVSRWQALCAGPQSAGPQSETANYFESRFDPLKDN